LDNETAGGELDGEGDGPGDCISISQV